MKPVLRDDKGRLIAGTAAIGTGRPQSSRQRIAEKLLIDLAAVWEVHGKTVLERLAKDEPGKLATIAYGLLPRDIFVRVDDNTSALAGDDRRMLLDLLNVVKGAGAEAGSPELVFQWIAEDLRARLAGKVIDGGKPEDDRQ
jgi:hypothetical protein